MEPGLFITVIGASDCSAEETKLAEEVGRELARRGATLICGGLEGVMEAACRGAYSQGGITIGILPGNSRKDANPYVRIPIVTGMGYTRNAIVAKSGQAVIAIGGSYGTLSEIAYALQSDIPVIGLGTWSLARGGVADKSIIVAQNPMDAVEKAIGVIRKG
ncbi:MAG TPA: TIGR00725 family protein [Dehalococcoidia bacterium]|nr:TIGR00725 family protein [Dehalococcoidia bacterium]